MLAKGLRDLNSGVDSAQTGPFLKVIDKISSMWAWVLTVSRGRCVYATYCLLTATARNLGRSSW